MPRPARTGPERAGQTLVELAFVLPLLLAFASGVLDAGVLLYDDLCLNGALAEVGRLAHENERTVDQLETVFQDLLGLPASQASFSVTTAASDPDVDGLPSAEIIGTFTQPWVGLVPWNGAPTVTLRARVRTLVRVQGTPRALVDP